MSGLVLAAAIPVKGFEGRYMLDKVLDHLAEAGDMEGRMDHYQVGPRACGEAIGQGSCGGEGLRANLWLEATE